MEIPSLYPSRMIELRSELDCALAVLVKIAMIVRDEDSPVSREIALEIRRYISEYDRKFPKQEKGN